jgi:hypothetical protein
MRRRDFLYAVPAFAAAQTPRPAYPRLYYSRATIHRLRTHPSRDWESLLAGAKRLLDSKLFPEDVAQKGGGQHANYGAPGNQIADMGMVLGLAFHVTSEKPYADKLREALLHYASYRRWSGQGLDERVPAWHSELNTARFCYGYATGYDALHDYLSPADRTTIREGLIRLGILPTLDDWLLPEHRIHALDSMGHNWWSVCVSMAGVAALAISADEPRAAEWLDRISRGLALWFSYNGEPLQNKPANFDPGGAFYEGPGYTNYGVGEYLKFRLAYANVFPTRKQPDFAPLHKLTGYFLHTLYPTTGGFYTVNFGDSSLHLRAGSTVRLLLETGYAHPLAGWYLQRTGADNRRGLDPLDLVMRQPVPPPAPPEGHPTSILYPRIGWATLRDSWKDDATLLAVKSGFTWNHTHADAGSFVLFHRGAPLITDSGACGYENPAYGSYYVQSRAHNVVLFEGKGQPREDIRRGVKTPGSVHDLIDGVDLKYVYADATGPMSPYFTRNFRHWLWIGGAILVFDDIRALEDGRIDWLLHYDGKAEREGNTVTLTNNAARATVRFLHPTGLAAQEEMGMPDHEPNRKVPYLVFSAPTEQKERKFVVAITPQSAAAQPAIEPLAAKNALGLRLRHGNATTDVYLNLQADGRRMHENSNNTIEGWDTDAYLIALTHEGEKLTRAFVSMGSYLRKGSELHLDSLSKVTAVWNEGEIHIQGQKAIDVAIRAQSKPKLLRVNGRQTEFNWREGTKQAQFAVVSTE